MYYRRYPKLAALMQQRARVYNQRLEDKIYQNMGAKGLISKRRGKKSNRAYSLEFENRIISIIHEKYDDFGPTFAREKLFENHDISISVETLRKLMIKHHLHLPREKKGKVHRSRLRRENFGELIQIDASIHDWFEGRSDKCALIVFIDDATSLVTSMHFHKSECLEAYFKALHKHLIQYGRPLGVYSDRHAIFGGADHIQNAQLVRAFKELDVLPYEDLVEEAYRKKLEVCKADPAFGRRYRASKM